MNALLISLLRYNHLTCDQGTGNLRAAEEINSVMKLILNIGCGSTTSDRCVNLDWSPYTRLARNAFLRYLFSPFIGERRRKRLASVARNIRHHDLRKGLPFGDGEVDAVYHSHFLEHLDRDVAEIFLTEVYRVMKPGAIQRIVVPDLSLIATAYLDSYRNAQPDHEDRIYDLLEQSVRRAAVGSSDRPRPLRIVENILLGDARRRGETHQWMYDLVNLGTLLKAVGFRDVTRYDFSTSGIDADWPSYRLDNTSPGEEYKPGSLYVECTK